MKGQIKIASCTLILLVAGKFWGKRQGGKMWSMKFYNWGSSVHRASPWVDNKLHKNDGQALDFIGNHDVRCSTHLIFALFCSPHSICCLRRRNTNWHLPGQKMNKRKTQSIWWRKLVSEISCITYVTAPLSQLDYNSIKHLELIISWVETTLSASNKPETIAE